MIQNPAEYSQSLEMEYGSEYFYYTSIEIVSDDATSATLPTIR